MKTEKIVISFIAVVIGILAAGVVFYFYQTTKTIPESTVKTITAKPSNAPTPKPSIFLTIDAPKDEEVVDSKTIVVKGTTIPDATVIVSSAIADQIAAPTANGSFTTTIVLESDENEITITAIAPTGEEITVLRTVTVSQETF